MDLTETTTLYCGFTGTSDYEACTSNEVTVEYKILLYQPNLDGTEQISNFNGADVTSGNGELTIKSRGYGYLTEGWVNTPSWKLTFDCYMASTETLVFIGLENKSQNDYQEIDLMYWENPMYLRIINNSTMEENITIPNSQSNTWHTFVITKNGTNITLNIDDGQDITTQWNNATTTSKMVIGFTRWSSKSAVNKIKNIKVIEL